MMIPFFHAFTAFENSLYRKKMFSFFMVYIPTNL